MDLTSTRDLIQARIKEYKKTINDLENKLIVEKELNKEIKRAYKSDNRIFKLQIDRLKKDEEIHKLIIDGLNDDVDVFQNQVKELKQDNKWLANRNKEIIKKKDDEINELKRKINYLNDDIDCLIEDKKEANKESERLREIIEM